MSYCSQVCLGTALNGGVTAALRLGQVEGCDRIFQGFKERLWLRGLWRRFVACLVCIMKEIVPRVEA